MSLSPELCSAKGEEKWKKMPMASEVSFSCTVNLGCLDAVVCSSFLLQH